MSLAKFCTFLVNTHISVMKLENAVSSKDY